MSSETINLLFVKNNNIAEMSNINNDEIILAKTDNIILTRYENGSIVDPLEYEGLYSYAISRGTLVIEPGEVLTISFNFRSTASRLFNLQSIFVRNGSDLIGVDVSYEDSSKQRFSISFYIPELLCSFLEVVALYE